MKTCACGRPATANGREWTREGLAWAAGLYEGEGYISSTHRNRATALGAQLAITMADLDVLQQFQRVWGMGSINGPHLQANRKPTWTWQIGEHEYVQAIIAAMWPWLHARRRDQIATVMHAANTYPRKYIKTRKDGLCRTEGCSESVRPHGRRGMCSLHYSREYHAEKRSRAIV